MRCRHPLALRRALLVADLRAAFPDYADAYSGGGGGRIVAEQCARCQRWIPLGPSDEAPVAHEVRAAEIVAAWTEAIRRRPFDARIIDVAVPAEVAGWSIRHHGSLKMPEQPGEWAGYLAHAIACHDEEPR